MPIMFNTLLSEAGVALKEVRLIRHKDKSAKRGLTPYELWRDNSPHFEWYQATQSIPNRPKFKAPYWAVFVVDHNDETLFVGLYKVLSRSLLEKDSPMPHRDGIDKAGSCDVYDLELLDTLKEFAGKLVINWGKGALAWIQHADRNDKPILEIRKQFSEPEFPGYLKFIQPLSKLGKIPISWVSALKSARGIYLLTCPKTKEQYVGKATGEDGFWGRWQAYLGNGHGGNLGLKLRDPSDYQVSILEIAGTSATTEDIEYLEGLWQTKLQSMEMGLNRNLAKRV